MLTIVMSCVIVQLWENRKQVLGMWKDWICSQRLRFFVILAEKWSYFHHSLILYIFHKCNHLTTFTYELCTVCEGMITWICSFHLYFGMVVFSTWNCVQIFILLYHSMIYLNLKIISPCTELNDQMIRDHEDGRHICIM